MHIVVIGLGGVGTALLYPLARYLSYEGSGHKLILIDGDDYEDKNMQRQEIDSTCLGSNKAESSLNRVVRLFPSMSVEAIAGYVSQASAESMLVDADVILVCVDNHKTRKVVQDACRKAKDVLLVTGGNELLTGNVQVFMKKGGRVVHPPIDKYHPEIAEPQDQSPDDISCDEMAQDGDEQIIFTNLTVACLMLNAFYTATTAKIPYSEVYFDVSRNEARAVTRK